MMDDLQISSDAVAHLAGMSVYFAHQSVGANILDGVSKLLADVQVATVRVADAGVLSSPTPGTVVHSFVGSNGDPRGKLAEFEKNVRAGVHTDIALLKFCFGDVHSGLSAEELFVDYRATLADLEGAFPATMFVHVTMPLTTRRGTLGTRLKNLAKRLSGYGTVQPLDWNEYRHEYNQLLREEYEGSGRLFDLARIQSTPMEHFEANKDKMNLRQNSTEPAPQLLESYTDDGAHLNAMGRLVVGRRFLLFLDGLIG